MAGNTWLASSPGKKGQSPVHMANVITPKAHASAPPSATGLPAHCSGARAYPVVTGCQPRRLCAL